MTGGGPRSGTKEEGVKSTTIPPRGESPASEGGSLSFSGRIVEGGEGRRDGECNSEGFGEVLTQFSAFVTIGKVAVELVDEPVPRNLRLLVTLLKQGTGG
jgi:hypothetical protein